MSGLGNGGASRSLNQKVTDSSGRIPKEQCQVKKAARCLTRGRHTNRVAHDEAMEEIGETEDNEYDWYEKIVRNSRDSWSSLSAAGSRIRDPRAMSYRTKIDYLYLTFNTESPAPNIPMGLSWQAVPAAPDLSRYVDPLRWPRARKNVMVMISCLATMFTAYTAGAYSPPVDRIAAELHTTHVVALLGVTTFCLGFAYAPMILAPFSEINGRYPVFAAAGVIFTVFQAVCGIVTTVPGMLLARFFLGAGGSVFSTMVGGVISDLYDRDARNTPMALFSGCVLFGTGLGPLISSVIVDASPPGSQTWKWVFWHQVIIDFLLMIAVVTMFKESRGPVVLSRKAAALNKWYEQLEDKGYVGVWIQEDTLPSFHPSRDTVRDPEGYEKEILGSAWPLPEDRGLILRRIRWKTKADEERGPLLQMVSTSLTRPFLLLFTEPIVFFFSLWVSFAWAVLYLTFASIPLVFRRQYNFDVRQSGYVFISMMIAAVIATVLGILQDSLLKHPKWRGMPGRSESRNSNSSSDDEENCAGDTKKPTPRGFWAFVRRRFPAESPESRLYFTCFTGVLLPIGLYVFGFSAQPSVPWLVPTVAIGFATAGIYYIYLATFNYLADIYQAYASSALAAQSFCRNILGGVFPLVTAMLFTNLGEKNAGALLGSIATVLTVVPWVLVLFGEKIRRRSKYAVALQK